MTSLIGLRGSRGGVRAPVGIAIALSLLVATAIESGHTHTRADLSAVCSDCKVGHQDAPTSAATSRVIAEPGVLQALALPGHRLIAGIVHLSPHRSRAPPLPVSL